MKTKHWFFRYAAAVIALALVLTGCNKDNIQVKTGYSNLRFVVNAGEKPGVAEGGDTRALKTGWADGDRIGVLFDIAGTHYALLEYADAAGTWTRLESSLPAELAAAGEVIALHAGNEGFGYSNTGNFTGIGGDLLYDGAGTYAYDSGTQTITLTLSMQRGLTTAIKMESTGTLEDNMKWRLAGPGVSVLTGNTFTPADYADFTFDTALPGLFSVSDAESGTGAVPDPAFTDNDMVVFHVLRSGEEAGETTLQLWNTDNPTTLYTRTYDNNLTAGGSVMLAGPTVDAEADEWAETTIEPSDNGITLWANDTGIPLDFTAAGNWTVTVTEGLTSSGSEAYWIELLAPEGYPAYGGPAGAVNLYAEIEPNTTGEERTATITIYDGTKQTIYHIIQSGTTKNGGFPMPYEPDPAGHDVMLMTPDGHGWLFAGAVQSPGIPDGMGPDPDGISYRRGLNGVKAGRFVFLRAVPHAGYEPPTWRVETAEGQQEIYLHLQEMDLDGELFAFFEMPDEAVTVQAMFLPTPPPTYTITVTAVGRGTAWAGYTETEAGTLVELRATANTDYEFVEWRSTDGNPIPFDGSWDKDDEYCYLVMPSRNVSVEAVFAPAAGTQDYNDITVTMTREGGVSAFASLDAGATSGVTTLTAKEDDVVYLTAAAQEGYTFAGWHGIGNFVSPDGESYNPSAIVMRRKEVNMKATFVPTGATSFIRRWGWLTGYIEITGNSFRSHGTYFLHEVFIKDVVWTPITGDAEYPTGYKISGTLIECFNYTTPAADVGSGENYVCIFLAADGKSIRVWDNFNYPGEIAPNGHVAR